MLRFIVGSEVAEYFSKLSEDSQFIDVAVAFWGRGATNNLKLIPRRCAKLRLICNIDSGACDPSEIELIQAAKIAIKTHRNLHAKVYMTNAGLIVGSANASTNGLSISASSSSNWKEANIVTDDLGVLSTARSWFEEMWKAGRDITADDIKKARDLWKKRRQLTLPDISTGKSLLAAISEAPEEFDEIGIYCIAYKDGFDSGASMKRKELIAGGKVRGAWYYQPTKIFRPRSWLISCNFKSRSHPKIDGYLYVPDEVPLWKADKDEPDLAAAYPKSAIRIGDTSFQLSDSEKEELLALLKEYVERHLKEWEWADLVVPLRDLAVKKPPSSSKSADSSDAMEHKSSTGHRLRLRNLPRLNAPLAASLQPNGRPGYSDLRRHDSLNDRYFHAFVEDESRERLRWAGAPDAGPFSRSKLSALIRNRPYLGFDGTDYMPLQKDNPPGTKAGKYDDWEKL